MCLRNAAGPSALLLAGLAAGIGLTSCSAFTKAGNNLGRGAVSAASHELARPELRSTLDTLVTVLGFSVRQSLDREIGPSLRSNLRDLLSESQAGIDTLGMELGMTIEGPLSRSFERFLATNMTVVGQQSREQLHLLLTQAGQDLSTAVLPAVRQSVAEAADSLVIRLSLGMENRMAASAETLAARAIRQAVLTADRTGRRSQTVTWIDRGFIVAVGVAILLVIAVVWQIFQSRRQARALDVLTGSIDRMGSSELKSTIRKQAQAQDVEGWLSSYLAKKRRL